MNHSEALNGQLAPPVATHSATATARKAVEVRNASVVYQTADTPVHALSNICLDLSLIHI